MRAHFQKQNTMRIVLCLMGKEAYQEEKPDQKANIEHTGNDIKKNKLDCFLSFPWGQDFCTVFYNPYHQEYFW